MLQLKILKCDIQLKSNQTEWLINKPYVNEGILRGKNLFLNAASLLTYTWRWFRSFHTGNTESIGQRAAKLPAVKVEGLKKKSAAFAITVVCVSNPKMYL